MRSTSSTCSGSLDFRNQNQIRTLAHHFRQIFESQRQLVDPHHALARSEIDSTQSISHQDASRIFLSAMHRIFQIENHRIGRMQRGVDVVFRLGSRQVEPRPAQTVLLRRRRQRMLLRQRAFAQRDASTPSRGLDASRDNKRQRAFIMNRNPRVLHAEFAENFPRLLEDRRAVIGRNPRLQRDLDPAAVTRLKGDVHIRPNFFAPMACLGRTRWDVVHSTALLIISSTRDASTCQLFQFLQNRIRHLHRRSRALTDRFRPTRKAHHIVSPDLPSRTTSAIALRMRSAFCPSLT